MGRSYKDLVAWQKSMDLVTLTYRATAGFPRDELFGLHLNFVERPFRFRVTSRRAKVVSLRRNSGIFLAKPEAL
jgi:hypothetical protein